MGGVVASIALLPTFVWGWICGFSRPFTYTNQVWMWGVVAVGTKMLSLGMCGWAVANTISML